MPAIIAGAAPQPGGEDHYRRLLARADAVIACDAAAEWCLALGRVPDLAVGDFDSARPGAVERLAAQGIETVTFPAAKDASDLDLAIAEARDRGLGPVTLTAVTALRLDHTLAAFGALASAADLSAAIDEPGIAAWALDSATRPSIRLRGSTGTLVSVFAIGAPACRVTLTGFRFPLSDARLEPLSSLGLSNELAAREATIEVGEGRLVVLSPGSPGVRART